MTQKSTFDRDKEEVNSRIQSLKAGLSEIREAGGTAWKEMSTGTSNGVNYPSAEDRGA